MLNSIAVGRSRSTKTHEYDRMMKVLSPSEMRGKAFGKNFIKYAVHGIPRKNNKNNSKQKRVSMYWLTLNQAFLKNIARIFLIFRYSRTCNRNNKHTSHTYSYSYATNRTFSTMTYSFHLPQKNVPTRRDVQ